MAKTICVYCASSENVAEPYFAAARLLGAAIAQQRLDLIYGGGNRGLMGALAHAVHIGGGRTTAVIPQALHDLGLTFEDATEIVITRNMRERKQTMEHRADAFIALPGGFGTLEEFLEVLTLKQLQYHAKPIVLLNTDGFYAPLLELFDHFIELQFVKPEHRGLFHVAEDAEAALAYIADYHPVKPISKFD
jgi:uncharacterized protein (TIGR00730 family)